MSFSIITEYTHPCLRPLRLTANSQSSSPRGNTKLRVVDNQRQATESSYWTATTHTFVGTGHRVSPSSWPPARFTEDPVSIPDGPKHNVPYKAESAHEHAPGSAEAVFRMFATAQQESGDSSFLSPRLVAKRYTPTRRSREDKDGLTLLMLTNMGLPKEMFEPMIEGLLAQQDANLEIAEVWSMDLPLSGETALVNPIGYLYGNEKDIARDLLLFLTSYLPATPGVDLPAELKPRQISPSDADAQQATRPGLHVIAHSLGAQSAMLIAAHAPSLLASLTVFDPAIIPQGKILKAFAAMPKDVLCTGIKYEHNDRAALASELNANKRTRGWNDRVKRIFVERGAVDVDGGQGKLRLAAHPRLEWALYYDQETPTNCYDRLADIRVPLNAIMPARPFAVPPAMLEADVAKLPQRTRLTWIPKASHQLPFERVEECTRLVTAWLKETAPSAKL